MSATIFCEGALYGPDGRELQHPNYRRASVPVDYRNGYHGQVRWEGLGGATFLYFALLICEKVLLETEPELQVVPGDGVVLVPLDIEGKGRDLPEPRLVVKP